MHFFQEFGVQEFGVPDKINSFSFYFNSFSFYFNSCRRISLLPTSPDVAVTH